MLVSLESRLESLQRKLDQAIAQLHAVDRACSQLEARVKELQALNESLAERVAAQSELLSKRAEKANK